MSTERSTTKDSKHNQSSSKTTKIAPKPVHKSAKTLNKNEPIFPLYLIIYAVTKTHHILFLEALFLAQGTVKHTWARTWSTRFEMKQKPVKNLGGKS